MNSLFMLLIFSVSLSSKAESLSFLSPNGVQEECRVLTKIPDAKYSKGDIEDESLLCSLDFYRDPNVALCSKTWSTSPATMIYDISKSGLSQERYEAQASCGGSKSGHDKITKFKQTLNMSDTSGTFAPSSFLYYHLSRYFDTSVDVPVAVYRSMDRQMHFDRVTKKTHENKMGKGAMIRQGWKWIYDFEKDYARNSQRLDFFTDVTAEKIYGMLGDGGGERYGAEINGVRSSWGDQQNYEFQETPAFRALRSEKVLSEAIVEGLDQGQKNSKLRTAMGGGASEFQMSIWMKEVTEIVILDYILNQQDRIGNIDFRWYYYWVDANGEVKSKKLEDADGENVETSRSKMSQISYPLVVDGAPTFLVQRSRINDNDAGVLRTYTNFTKRTGMLQKIRHIDVQTYEKLLALNEDLQSEGPIFKILKADYFISERDLKKIVSHTLEATNILIKTNAEGKLKFDLGSAKKMFNQFYGKSS